MKNKCIVCGFDKTTHNHHIIKKRIGGTDEESNIVSLCPNHHWIADFGTPKDRKDILKLIKELIGKKGEYISNKDHSFLDKKIFAIQERFIGKINKLQKKEFRKTSNYEQCKSFLLGRGCPPQWTRVMNEKAEKYMLIRKLEDSIPRCE